MKIKIYPNMTLESSNRNSLFNMLAPLYNVLVDSHNQKITEVLNSKALAKTRVTDDNRHELEQIEKRLLEIEMSLSDNVKETVINALNGFIKIARDNDMPEEDLEKDLSRFKTIANSLLDENFF